jgi:hypothetical protein
MLISTVMICGNANKGWVHNAIIMRAPQAIGRPAIHGQRQALAQDNAMAKEILMLTQVGAINGNRHKADLIPAATTMALPTGNQAIYGDKNKEAMVLDNAMAKEILLVTRVGAINGNHHKVDWVPKATTMATIMQVVVHGDKDKEIMAHNAMAKEIHGDKHKEVAMEHTMVAKEVLMVTQVVVINGNHHKADLVPKATTMATTMQVVVPGDKHKEDKEAMVQDNAMAKEILSVADSINGNHKACKTVVWEDEEVSEAEAQVLHQALVGSKDTPAMVAANHLA